MKIRTESRKGKQVRIYPYEVMIAGPGCLSKLVESLPAQGFAQIGDGDDFSPIRRMKCLACGAGWWRGGV